MNEDTEEEWLTVAQAAQRLDIAQKQVRRYAARLTPAQRREPEDTPEGHVPLRVLFSAVVALRHAGKGKDTPKDSGRDTVPEFGDTGEDTEGTGVPPMPLSVIKEGFFDQIVASQVALLAEKDERIADLQAALDHAREQEHRLTDQMRQMTEALRAEQMLRALGEPPPSANAPKPSDSPETDGGAGVDSQTGAETPTEAPERGIRAFWKRLTGQ